jgi:hypothetical protein
MCTMSHSMIQISILIQLDVTYHFNDDKSLLQFSKILVFQEIIYNNLIKHENQETHNSEHNMKPY